MEGKNAVIKWQNRIYNLAFLLFAAALPWIYSIHVEIFADSFYFWLMMMRTRNGTTTIPTLDYSRGSRFEQCSSERELEILDRKKFRSEKSPTFCLICVVERVGRSWEFLLLLFALLPVCFFVERKAVPISSENNSFFSFPLLFVRKKRVENFKRFNLFVWWQSSKLYAACHQ